MPSKVGSVCKGNMLTTVKPSETASSQGAVLMQQKSDKHVLVLAEFA